MSKKKKEPLTPWHDAKGKMHFPYRALESKAFIWPTPPPETFYGSNILIPIHYQKYYAEGYGILLSIGPGYWTDKGKWIPIDPLLKPGSMIAYDKTVPWSIMLDDSDGKTHEVVRCVEADIGGVVKDV
jgi:hypothetical protein